MTLAAIAYAGRGVARPRYHSNDTSGDLLTIESVQMDIRDARGLEVLDVTRLDQPRYVEGATVPLADAMARISPALSVLMLVGAALSMLGWMGSDLLGTPRILFAFARDGRLPRVLGRVHPHTRAPHVAIVVYAVLAIGVSLTGSFAELAVLSTAVTWKFASAGQRSASATSS